MITWVVIRQKFAVFDQTRSETTFQRLFRSTTRAQNCYNLVFSLYFTESYNYCHTLLSNIFQLMSKFQLKGNSQDKCFKVILVNQKILNRKFLIPVSYRKLDIWSLFLIGISVFSKSVFRFEVRDTFHRSPSVRDQHFYEKDLLEKLGHVTSSIL